MSKTSLVTWRVLAIREKQSDANGHVKRVCGPNNNTECVSSCQAFTVWISNKLPVGKNCVMFIMFLVFTGVQCDLTDEVAQCLSKRRGFDWGDKDISDVMTQVNSQVLTVFQVRSS